VVALGVNCTPPRFISPLLEAAASALEGQDRPPLLLAYPNSGEGWLNKTGTWDGHSELEVGTLGLPIHLCFTSNICSEMLHLFPFCMSLAIVKKKKA